MSSLPFLCIDQGSIKFFVLFSSPAPCVLPFNLLSTTMMLITRLSVRNYDVYKSSLYP